MITIGSTPHDIFSGTISQFLEKFQAEKSAFVGKVGNGPGSSVYLRTFSGVLLLENPVRSWTGETQILVEKFVDLKVKVC